MRLCNIPVNSPSYKLVNSNMIKPIRVAVIGTGYLGKFHVEKLARLPTAQLIGVVDINPERAQAIADQYQTQAFTDFHAILDKVEAVTIAVPTVSHYLLAKTCLTHGIHVLLEKPMTSTLEEADELIELARTHNCILQIGHVERFNPTVKGLLKWLNKPRFIQSYRLASFQLRGTDVSVILDLMIHDLDLIHSLVQSPIATIEAIGAPVLSNHIDIANARIRFENGCIADLTASRISFRTERKLRIFQPDGYIAANLHKKIAVKFDREIDSTNQKPFITQRQEKFATGDALFEQIAAFIQAVHYNQRPVVSGEEGRAALAAALQITKLVHDSLATIPK